ncbi:ribosome recycling factor family protein [Shewanella gaetbuli]|uniref:Ribosome recycling factor family protein n=1 Tax=Shewanella gaetbuli TaxID=220752 RepID=A0A9X1ZHG2_9GAMM|nr:ribosome recycling factor family protein [Shewanella gaetbuli]
MSDNNHITVRLPSFIHRIGTAQAQWLKLQAVSFNCELKRVRRSRHWQLYGDAKKIQQLGQHLQLNQQSKASFNAKELKSLGYFIGKMEQELVLHPDKLESLEAKLIRLINQSPNITLAELIALTGCTEPEARIARFNADDSV